MTATIFQLVTPYITTFLSLSVALFLYLIKDYDPLTRGYERYTKRFQFHKAEHELRAIAQIKPTEEDLERCRHSLRNSASWIAMNLTIASRLAGGLSFIFTSLLMLYIGGIALRAYPGSAPGQSQIFQSTWLITFLLVFFFTAYRLYVIAKRGLTDVLLSLSKKNQFFSYLGKMIDD